MGHPALHRLWLALVWLVQVAQTIHGEALPACFTLPQHQQHFNGSWTARRTATWESCRFFDHYTTGDARAVCKCVPNGDQAAVVIKRGAIDPEKIRIAEQRHPQTAFIQLSKMHPPLCNAVARAYAKLRLEARGDEAGKELHPVATTGLAAVLAALALCDKVSIYGFGLPEGVPHHYHDAVHKLEKSHDYPDEEVFFNDLADGTLQVELPFLTSANHTLTLPPVTWVDRPPRDAKIELHPLIG